MTTPPIHPNFLKLEGDQIFIDASHRRNHLDKWVFLCIGDANIQNEIYEATIFEEREWPKNVLPTDITQGIVDLNYWADFFRQQKFSPTKINSK